MDSFTIYKEYYELIQILSEKEQEKLILAICKYMFDDLEPIDLNKKQMSIFKNLKRPLNKSKNNSKRSKGNGAPVGNNNAQKNKPKTNQKQTKNKPEDKPKTNTSNDVYVNVNKSNKKDNRGMGEEEKEEKIQYAEFVTMTNVEYEKLINTYGKEFTERCIETLDNYKGSSGKKYKSDYRAILNWVIEKVETCKPKKTNKPSWMEKEVVENTATDEEIEELMKQLGGK